MNENRAVSKSGLSAAGTVPELKAEQTGGGLSGEKHPNLTLLESGQNPGEILRAAREKAGYSLSDISAQTKINERQLLAIESGDVSRLPPETFAKAFIKSYCKALKMDPTPVILSFGFSEGGSVAASSSTRTGQADAARNEPIEPKMPNSSKRLSSLNFDRKAGKKSLGYGIALAAVAVLAVFYIPVFLENQNAEVTDPDATDPVSQSEPNSMPPVGSETAQVPQAPSTSLPSGTDPTASAAVTPIFPALQQPAANTSVDATAGASGGTPATGSAGSSSGATGNAAAVSPTAAPSAAGNSSAPVLPGASSAGSSPAKPAVGQSAAPAIATPAAPAPASQAPAVVAPVASAGALSFSFQEQSWVTVRDANDKVLISQLNQAGSRLEIKGQAPFKLIVGNAKSVSVTSGGKPVDLSTSIKGEVARLTVQ
ncbi:MAG TPA: RodZ domain-containing protein [Limnobacter sp.]|nr:RodZ domain-containing protein [Limnobacter sp.]